jgi:cytochrome b pre-mRNA-processing protein 3
MLGSIAGASLPASVRTRNIPMLRFLFPGLTAAPERGAALFAAITEQARRPHWYVEGAVPDSVDGRFRVLAALTALVIVRLEQAGEEGRTASVAVTERFIEVMESEHRELGLGDPGLGRTVRKLVSVLARRVELWRGVVEGQASWADAVRDSLYKGEADAAAAHSESVLRTFWSDIEHLDATALARGQLR